MPPLRGFGLKPKHSIEGASELARLFPSLSMAGAAARDVFHAAHVVLLDQGRAECTLIGVVLAIKLHHVRAARRLVAHVENLIARAEILFRSAMAPQAPLH